MSAPANPSFPFEAKQGLACYVIGQGHFLQFQERRALLSLSRHQQEPNTPAAPFFVHATETQLLTLPPEFDLQVDLFPYFHDLTTPHSHDE